MHGHLRILLLNNGCGGIFHHLSGLEQSTARDGLVAGAHNTNAEGICRQNNVTYLKAENMEQLQQQMSTFFSIASDGPVLLEVFTDATEDTRIFKDYYKSGQMS